MNTAAVQVHTARAASIATWLAAPALTLYRLTPPADYDADVNRETWYLLHDPVRGWTAGTLDAQPHREQLRLADTFANAAMTETLPDWLYLVTVGTDGRQAWTVRPQHAHWWPTLTGYVLGGHLFRDSDRQGVERAFAAAVLATYRTLLPDIAEAELALLALADPDAARALADLAIPSSSLVCERPSTEPARPPIH